MGPLIVLTANAGANQGSVLPLTGTGAQMQHALQDVMVQIVGNVWAVQPGGAVLHHAPNAVLVIMIQTMVMIVHLASMEQLDGVVPPRAPHVALGILTQVTMMIAFT